MIETRKTEIRCKTSDPKRMLNRYIAGRVLKTWKEDFVDDSTGEVTSIERNEVLFDKGTLIDQDTLAQIRFYMQEGSIKEVEVSNQKRLSFENTNTCMYIYVAQVQIKDKKYKFLLFGTNVENVVEILKDYIELNFEGGFTILMVKEHENRVIIIDDLGRQKKYNVDLAYLKDEITMDEWLRAKIEKLDESDDEEDSKIEMRYYDISSRIILRDKDGHEEEHTWGFIVKSTNAERANILINVYLKEKQDEEYRKAMERGSVYEKREIHSSIEESKIIPVGCFIPREFSEAYQ